MKALFVLNDPYFGGSHLPDITIIAPIFYDDQLMFYAVNRAHHSDIGGATYGGYNPAASEIYHEGLRSKEMSVRVKPGDRIFCLSAGGGGFGDPRGRPPAQRAWDVQNGYCSGPEQA